jgi:hypothetical protein
MTELEVLHRVERLARNVKMNANGALSHRSAKCVNCGQPNSSPRGVHNEVRELLMKNLRELESAFVELDMLRAGARVSP